MAPAEEAPSAGGGGSEKKNPAEGKDYYRQGSTEVAKETALTIKKLESVSTER
jgi:hypothetical protein